MAATAPSLHSVECSDQPLDLSFHPTIETIVAAALVDGTLEVHDFKTTLSSSAAADADQEDDSADDEDDTIVSSTHVHSQLIPNHIHGGSASASATSANHKTKRDAPQKKPPAVKKASCRAVCFSNTNNNGSSRLYTGGSAGDLCCIDAERVCSFSASEQKSVLWRIDSASVGPANSVNNPLHVLHQLPACSSKGPLIVSGDDHGGVRLWDDRLCNVAKTAAAATPNNYKKMLQQAKAQRNNGPLQLPQGCVLSWKESKDYISALDHSDDGNTLLAASADGSLTIFDLRKASTTNILQNTQQQGVLRQSDPQDDELLSMVTLKQGKKVVCGTQEGVLAMWSWGTWGDISDRYPNAHNGYSVDAMLKLDEDTLLTGSSDGLVRVVSLHPNKVVGALGEHDGFPIEAMQFNSTRNFVGSISHDNYIRLWDTNILKDQDDDDDDDSDDEVEGKGAAMPNAAPPAAATTRGGQASDDEWDDMDEEDDEAMDDDENDQDEAKGGGDSDDSDEDSDDDEAPSTNDNRASRFTSKNNEFFADL